MPLTSNWNIWTPDDADNYDFIVDSAATAQTVDDALTDIASAFKGTVAERTAFTATAVDGMLWQDTDGIKMIWRKESAAWVPAVWRWSGTDTEMNSFAAPNGFEWHNSTDGVTYTKRSSTWYAPVTPWVEVMTASGSEPRAAYRLNNGLVQISGIGSKPGSTYQCFSLPSGFRPSRELRFSDVANLSQQIVINAAGSVSHTNLNATVVGFMCSFRPAV